jgi:hypothetical protein
MDMLYYVGITSIIVGSVIYAKKTNVTKKDCIQFSLQSIDKLNTLYTNVEKNVIDIIDCYTKTSYKDLEIVSKKIYKDTIIEIVYNYNDQLFYIMYDPEFTMDTIYNVGDNIDNKEIFVSPQKNKIVLVEFIHTETNQTKIIEHYLKKNIISMAGPNQDFYNKNKQPLYIPNALIDKDIVEDINNYTIQITYMDLKQIQRKIIII